MKNIITIHILILKEITKAIEISTEVLAMIKKLIVNKYNVNLKKNYDNCIDLSFLEVFHDCNFSYLIYFKNEDSTQYFLTLKKRKGLKEYVGNY